MKRAVPAILIVAAAFALIGAASPGATAAQERHHHFHEIGRAFKDVTDQLKRRPADFTKARTAAAAVATLAPQVKGWFPAGSGPQDGVKTQARAEAWTNRAELDRLADRFAAAAQQLKAAADGGDLAALKLAVRATGETCKSCHQTFKG
jgi:cytochrome c556